MKRASLVLVAAVCLSLAATLVAVGQDTATTEPSAGDLVLEAGDSIEPEATEPAGEASGTDGAEPAEEPAADETADEPDASISRTDEPAWGMPEEEDDEEIVLTADQRALYEEIGEQIDVERMERGIRDLASLGSRVSGTPGNLIAGTWVVDQFRSIGLEDVRIEEFEVTVPVDHGTWVDLNGEEIRVYPLWPNLVRTCSVPTEGIGAALVDGGSGSLHDLSGRVIDSSIVLMDWTDDASWFNAPLLGARAVIFIEPELISRGSAESKFLSVPADIPRFWIPREQGLALREQLAQARAPEARLFSDVRWESRTTFNVLGEITGTENNPMPGHAEFPGSAQRIVLSAYYDSISVVPDLAPGAENAASIVTLLEIARVLKERPPRRSVLFLATSGHFQSLYGIRDFFNRRFAALVRPPEEVNTILAAAGERPDTIGPMDVAAMFGIDVSSRNDLVCAMYKGYFYDYVEDIQWKYSDYGSNSQDWARGIQKALGYPNTTYADAINSITGRNWRSYLPGRLAMDFEEATVASRPAIGFCTGNDMRAYVDTPHD
ncbi:MAG: M28 family peptidase, partial [Armatimonadia bacterium]|nr:M28 family peptidase [Armatimonadia bacterium]